jgi:hypothetical protein
MELSWLEHHLNQDRTIMQFLMQVVFGRTIGQKEKASIVLSIKTFALLSLLDLNQRPSD